MEKTVEQQIEDLAEDMDNSAEQDNSHDFVGVHRALACIAYKELGPEQTLKLFQALARELCSPEECEDGETGQPVTYYWGGLWELRNKESGHKNRIFALKTLTVPCCWRDWSLTAPRFDPTTVEGEKS